MSVPMICALVASLLLVASYVTYCNQAVKGHSTPNLVTMLIMLPVTGLNAWTYWHMLDEDPFRAILSLALCALSILMFCFLKYHNLLVPHWDLVSKVTATLAIAAFVTWWLSNATIGNLAIQVVLISAFVPIVSGIRSGELKERPIPWALAVAAYMVSLVPLFDPWQGIAALAFPLLSGMGGNGTIAVLSFLKNRTTK